MSNQQHQQQEPKQSVQSQKDKPIRKRIKVNKAHIKKTSDDAERVLTTKYGEKPSAEQLYEDYGNDDEVTNQLNQIIKSLGGKNGIRTGLQLVGERVAKNLNKNFSALSLPAQKVILASILGDDIGSLLLPILREYGPKVLQKVMGGLHKKLRQWNPYRTVTNFIGLDDDFANDDPVGYIQNPSYYNNTTVPVAQMGNMRIVDNSNRLPVKIELASERADGVNKEAFGTILAPEYFCERISGDCTEATAITAKQFAITLTTNGSGNCIFVYNPRQIFAPGVAADAFGLLYNDNALNILSGVQTPAPIPFAGPLSGVASQVGKAMVAGFSMQLNTISPLFTTQGYMTVGMTQEKSDSSWTVGTYPLAGQTLVQTFPYVFQGTLSKLQPRMVYYPLDGTLNLDITPQATGYIADRGLSCIVINGGPSSSACIQLTFSYVVEFQALGTNRLLQAYQPPKPGIFTVKLVNNLVAIDKRWLMMGGKETAELVDTINSTTATYDSLWRALNNKHAKTLDLIEGLKKGVQSLDQLQGNYQPFISQPSQVVMLSFDKKQEKKILPSQKSEKTDGNLKSQVRMTSVDKKVSEDDLYD